MATITSLGANDDGATSRSTINTNFTNLNTDKIETSAISTDGTLAGNSDTELPTEKAVKTYVDATAVAVSAETTADVTHSLTTTAGQVVVVWAKGVKTGDNDNHTITLAYGGVAKDTVTVNGNTSSDKHAFALMYTETPGAATEDITVTTSGGTLTDVDIMVLKIG